MALAGLLALRQPVFVDTGAWQATSIRRDRLHQIASSTWTRLWQTGRSLVTTNLVVGETYTSIRAHYGYDAAWHFLDLVERTNRLTRHFVNAELEAQAYAILREYRDQAFSYVDATSFAFMRTHGIREAFAFDAHFATAGFTRIPRDQPLG